MTRRSGISLPIISHSAYDFPPTPDELAERAYEERENAKDEANTVPCDHCEGSGVVWESCACYQCEYSSEHSGYVPCLNCDGTGRVRRGVQT